MFNEDDDWSDEHDAQTPSKSVPKNIKKANNDANVKPKLVGKKSLLRTLQTLGSVPEWKSDDHQQGSDSETEATPLSSKKKKKKRRKKRKNPGTSEEQQENGDLNQSVKEEKPVAKKRNKAGTLGPKVKSTSAGEKKDEEMITSAKTNTNNAENTEKLSRQQWKNKMKNKRKYKNKYRPEEGNQPKTVDEPKPKDELKNGSSCNNSSKENTKTVAQKKKKEKEHKPQKRKRIEVDTDISCASDKNQLNKTEAGCEDAMVTADQEPLLAKGLKLKEQSLKREKLRKILQSKETDQQEGPTEQRAEPAVPEAPVIQDRSASLRSRMEQRLESARFRYINEVLYSTSSGEAKRMFTRDPEAFWIYHKGYTAQVQRWPTNPVETIISYIQHKPSSLVVADFGCGDCKIARSVKNKVHSFDLAATCELVTVCDMANVPLADGSVDIAVFCLSLMGTNLADFLAEANRVLKMQGALKIAEVASRFDNVHSFITALANLRFKLVSKDTENTHFYSFEFVKTGDAPENVKKFGLELKPCVYKKR